MSLLIYFFCFVCLIQLFYYFYYFAKLAFYNEKTSVEVTTPVSVIIAAKNEEDSLKEYLKLILEQEYDCFEVIVVNNLSEDKTLDYLKSVENDKLKIFDCDTEGKKAALLVGINKAQYEQLVFIDADCKPNSSEWLKLMVQKLQDEHEIVLGYGAFIKENSLLNKVVQFENVLNAAQYFSYALRGNSYMGVGRNLAYTKSIFNGSKAFLDYQTIKSGDDDLIVNEMATATNVGVCVNKNAHTISKAETSWSSLFRQKRRQLIAGNYYKSYHRFSLGLFGATNFLYYSLFITMLVISYYNTYILVIFVVKQLLEYFLFSKICIKLNNKEIPKWIIILEPLYLVFITLVGVSTWLWRVDKWK